MQRAELERVLEAHAEWLASGAGRGVRADLTGRTIDSVDLSGVDLRWAILRDTVWTGARLAGALLTAADLRGAVLRDADLNDARLVFAKLQGADLRGADLRGARLVHSVGFNELDLPRAFVAANLSGATLEGAQFDESLEGTGAVGPYQEWGDTADFAWPAAPVTTRALAAPLTTAEAPPKKTETRFTLEGPSSGGGAYVILAEGMLSEVVYGDESSAPLGAEQVRAIHAPDEFARRYALNPRYALAIAHLRALGLLGPTPAP